MANTTNQAIFKVKPWTIAVPAVLIALIFMPTAMVIGAAMVPAIVAYVVDTSPGRRLTITVAAMNLVGSLYFMHRIWTTGNDVASIGPTLTDSFGWLCALLGAGAGWVIFGFMPTLVTHVAAAQTAVRLRRLNQAQEKLVKEWGETVRGVYGVKAVAADPVEPAAED